ncbi:hypothetical protein H0486_16110 [Lachnospiraceae bacterium MD1]|uniref:Uncharacterized protein n=1 Tax=Variimorphobacter saccharofermentans TaxID=2755051 RepID=A0A839K3C3_9FIRM|nr:hypothetical protein [Variimorphobacter saccharofermentans]MBB2184405.1 hypothetical protein [Variimorphobacter saccharofermentans]
MNKAFIIKMMKAKKMQYEALKEIIPEKMVNKISDLENEVIDLVKEYAMSEFTETKCKNNTSEETASKKVHKVTIES